MNPRLPSSAENCAVDMDGPCDFGKIPRAKRYGMQVLEAAATKYTLRKMHDNADRPSPSVTIYVLSDMQVAAHGCAVKIMSGECPLLKAEFENLDPLSIVRVVQKEKP